MVQSMNIHEVKHGDPFEYQLHLKVILSVFSFICCVVQLCSITAGEIRTIE